MSVNIKSTHPIYDLWSPTWQLLQDVYRGDGGFLSGAHLVAHPREIRYAVDADGLATPTVLGHKDKYKRRQALARYENIARTIIDTFSSHLSSRPVMRETTNAALTKWWDDVDGSGTHIDDWMAWQQILAWVYGYVVTIMDRESSEVDEPQTKAQQGAPVMRCYTPLDVLDWIYAGARHRAVKVVEQVPRADLMSPYSGVQTPRGSGDGAPMQLSYVVWDDELWARYDDQGVRVASGPHAMGITPSVIHYARRVPGLDAIGLSLLGDPRVHRDHYNLVSEEREILRAQVFSMLSIQLSENEDVGQARGRLGDSASVESVVWSRGGAEFIAPPEGPSRTYQDEKKALERTMYRLAGCPWDGDTGGAESADSRRLKSSDFNRMLASYADEAERVEYAVVSLWYRATMGLTDDEAIDEQMERDGVVIRYADEFGTLDVAQTAADVRDVSTLGLGPKTMAMVRRRAIPVILPDLTHEDREIVDLELTPPEARQMVGMMARVAAVTQAKPVEAASGADDRETGVDIMRQV